MPMRVAFAPVRMPVQDEPEPGKARESFPLTAEPQEIRESIVKSMTKVGIFREVQSLDTPQPGLGEKALMQAAWEHDYDLVLSLDIQKFETFYDGVNGWYIPNILNWLFLLVPSWWVKDEVYGARISAEATLRSARSGAILYQKEHNAEFKRSLNDFQRGWQLAGIFRVPGSLGESNWRRISSHMLPGILHEIQVQTILGLHSDFRETALQADFQRLLRTGLALVVGVSRHKDTQIPKLKYTEEDAIALQKYLTAASGGRIPARNVKLLTNERATKAEILEGLDYLARKSREHDSVIIYFAGYGAGVAPRDDSGEKSGEPALYLVPYDADRGDIRSTCISISEIEAKVSGIEAREIVIILDAGFGTVLESRSLGGTVDSTPVFGNLLKQPGRCVLLSGKPGEGAMEISDHRHGIFTFYMLEGLKGPADGNKDDVITLAELHSYLETKVPEETEMEGSAQHPELHGTGEMVLKSGR
jgi:hypothetical protein